MSGYGERLRILAPHYVVTVVLILAVLTLADAIVGEISFAPRMILAIGTGLAYPLALRQLGRAPEPWQ